MTQILGLHASEELLFSVLECVGWREGRSKYVPLSVGVEGVISSMEGAILSSQEWVRSVFDREAFI